MLKGDNPALCYMSCTWCIADTAYSTRCLEAAKSMYDFGKNNPGTYGNSIPNIGRYYA
jgi:hypothetical protein